MPFEILTNDKLESARTGNWFLETNLVIARLDKLSRNEDVQQKLQTPDCRWDLVVCDEAHKMSATVFGTETKYTKRYRLGQLLSTLTRHFLLMTATPHNGKETDFQLFMALLDGDRFEGRFRDGVHVADVSDLMRRMVKESLLKFDGTPLFPERIAYTVPYKLSEAEAQLYKAVTDYVREEFNRAEALANDKRAGTVGFALTILQRRLASSPEAIYQSLRRRRERLESRLREMEVLQRGGQATPIIAASLPALDAEDVEDLEDAPDNEVAAAEEEILDQATAARTIAELKAEIETLKGLESLALGVRRSGMDTKWRELSTLMGEIFTTAAISGSVSEPVTPYGSGAIPRPTPSLHQKLVLFTEHRDTLNYLESRITTLLGRNEAVVMIHGGMGREERMKAQESFKHDPEVQVLLATDAAGEGINLQRAHLMVNYDLPWNPNRIEQRFGRIHRIGQTEVCHLWNLVAEETREGDVYRKLLEKLEQARQSLGGQVFDVLGKLQFDGKLLRDLLIEAIRYGDQPEVRARLTTVVEHALDRDQLQDLLEDHALVHDAMDASRVQRIREDMERAEARRLQPHYIESFFLEAFRYLGGSARQREPRRYEITHVPAPVRNRDRLIGIGEPVLPRYERIAFEKSLVAPQGQPLAAFVCPGHSLLDSVIDLTLERHRDLLKRGAVLVDDSDASTQPRVMFYLEHAIQDASMTRTGERRVVSRRILYVELDADGATRHVNYAPYLDYRPLAKGESSAEAILDRSECAWITRELEKKAQGHAVVNVVPQHLEEVRGPKLALIDKTEAAVKERLTKEITYWDHRAEQLKLQEQAGKTGDRLNSGEARKRADLLQGRLQKRLEDLKLEAQISPLPPVVLGGMLVVPIGLLMAMTGQAAAVSVSPADTQASAARARVIVMEVERSLGFAPTDREFEKLGYDVESSVPGTGKLRFIEVKGRVSGASARGLAWRDQGTGETCATAAGIVLLAKDPSMVFPQCRILADAYRSTEPDGDPRDHEDIRSPMPLAIDRAIAFIDRNTRHPMRIVGLDHLRLDEYPVDGLREALVNAVAHRQYEDAGRKIILEIFADRVTLLSPGLPPRPLTLANLRKGKYRPCSRNPVLAQCLSYFHRIEERGSGFRRMHDQMLDHGLDPPLLGTDMGYFQITFPGPGDNIERLRVPEKRLLVTRAVEAQLNERQKRIVKHVLESGSVTSGWCLKEFGVVYNTAYRDLDALVRLGLLKQEGSGRGTRYSLQGTNP